MTMRTKDDEIHALKEGLSACRALAEQQRKTCKSVLDGLRSQHKVKDAEIARLRAALAQIRDAAHENGVAWTERVASKALEDV